MRRNAETNAEPNAELGLRRNAEANAEPNA